MVFDVIIIVATVLSLIWFIAVWVLLDKIAKYLRLSLQAKYYNGLYIGMKIKHIATHKEYTIVKIDGDTIKADTGKSTQTDEGEWVCVYETLKRSDIIPYFD